MPSPVDPTAAAFLLAESRRQPMHVGGLQLFRPPEGNGRAYGRTLYEHLRDVDEVAPLFARRPVRSVRTAGALVWERDDDLDLEHHVRHAALPRPGRVRELLELCSRMHGQRLARERPLWESTVVEGLRDGRVAMYTKCHHALVDGVAAMRLLQSALSTDPDERGVRPPWAAAPASGADDGVVHAAEHGLDVVHALGSALGIAAEAAGLPGALARTVSRGLRHETSSISLSAPRTILNQTITGSRRFAAQDWPIERLRAVGRASGTTINDVVLAMCAGALRAYLLELDALPEASLVAMVPVGLKARQVAIASDEGGNSLGAVMVSLGTDRSDPADRLAGIHASMLSGKRALSQMTPTQILAMTGLGLAPAVLAPALRLQGILRPPFNVVISNVPGPRRPLFLNGAELLGTYPLSIPLNGMALNITCASYAGRMCFGLTGCRRTLPHLQRMLGHLEADLRALERAAGV